MKLPFCKFYPRDWSGDPQLRLCSLAARGLWAEMLCIMAMSERRGFLEVSGRTITTPEQLARLTGSDAAEVKVLLSDLEQADIFSRDESGTIYSRRMVKDAEARERSREFGKRGGNPALITGRVNPAPYPDGLNLETRNQKPEKRERERQFKIPSLIEVQTYGQTIEKPADLCGFFFDYWQGFKWRDRDGEAVDWKTKLRTFSRKAAISKTVSATKCAEAKHYDSDGKPTHF